MANGKKRDAVRTDIPYHGSPTLSPEADEYYRRIARLSDTNASEALERLVDVWLRGVEITSVSKWLSDPSIYLRDLEPERVSALEEVLRGQLAERVHEARQRGWEIE